VRHTNEPYRLGYAESVDGLNWKRKDNDADIQRSPEGWDSQMVCYASVIEAGNRTFLFYNGNNNGESGLDVRSGYHKNPHALDFLARKDAKNAKFYSGVINKYSLRS
jgi:hypothetical protein